MVMDKFESQFEDLDVQTEYMEGAMAGTTTMTTPQGEVDTLMQQVADEHGLELNQEFGSFVPGTSIAGLNKQEEKDVEADKLDERLRALRQWWKHCKQFISFPTQRWESDLPNTHIIWQR